MKIKANSITIRWWDGFKRTYNITEFEPGCDYLWISGAEGDRWIPTRMVRWFSPDANQRPTQ